MKYKGHLNPKCNRLFQRHNRGENARYWYSNVPLGRNSIGEMMPSISTNGGFSQRYANHSTRPHTVHILDSNTFSGRHVTSITGHKYESSLKTYTGYTAPNIKRKMAETISKILRPEKQSKTYIETDKENDINRINSDLVPLSNSQWMILSGQLTLLKFLPSVQITTPTYLQM